MRLLFSDVLVTDENSENHAKRVNIAVGGNTVEYVGEARPDGKFDRIISGNYLVMPGFYNAHCHSAMTLFRGLGGDLPLKRWLDEAILPAEDRLTPELVRLFSTEAIAEMIACGTVSFSDMYFSCADTARAALDSGIKLNIARSVVSFDENADPASDSRVAEAIELYREWNGEGDGRIKVDFSLHAEYTNTPRMCEYLADIAHKYDAGMQIHLSETEEEHLRCIEKYSMTPAAFFAARGVLGKKTSCAHGVWVSDDDIALLCESGTSVVHCPRSNLKLGSGVAPLERLMNGGVNVALGTDGAASNNRLSVFDEYSLAALLHKGVSKKADSVCAPSLLPLISENGAISQQRENCGKIKEGYRADFAVLDLDSLHSCFERDIADLFAYTLSSADVCMTVVDGKILYENGEYTTIDAEKLKYDVRKAADVFYGGTNS